VSGYRSEERGHKKTVLNVRGDGQRKGIPQRTQWRKKNRCKREGTGSTQSTKGGKEFRTDEKGTLASNDLLRLPVKNRGFRERGTRYKTEGTKYEDTTHGEAQRRRRKNKFNAGA